MSNDIRRTVDAVWRIESARIVATLAEVTGDFGTAEDLAQEALVEALEQWPDAGVPRNPGAWLTLVAKRRAIDGWRRSARLHDRERLLAAELAIDEAAEAPDIEPIDDDLLRLIFTACHPVLGRPAQVALTLRVVAGLSTDEIARMTFEPVATVQARITRAKKTLAAAHVPFETPPPQEWRERLAAVRSSARPHPSARTSVSRRCCAKRRMRCAHRRGEPRRIRLLSGTNPRKWISRGRARGPARERTSAWRR